MSELKMPMPKLPDIRMDTEAYEEGVYEEEIEEFEEEGGFTEEAIASIIGFVSAFGLPQPWLSRKALEYKQAAIDVGLARNLSVLLEKYFPAMEDKPEYAVLLSLLAFAALVISDRMDLQRKLKGYKVPKGAQPDVRMRGEKPVIEEVVENVQPGNVENAQE